MSADLFTWREEIEAAERAAEAERAREEALRKVICAPHGQIGVRRQRLVEATNAALRAEVLMSRTGAGDDRP